MHQQEGPDGTTAIYMAAVYNTSILHQPLHHCRLTASHTCPACLLYMACRDVSTARPTSASSATPGSSICMPCSSVVSMALTLARMRVCIIACKHVSQCVSDLRVHGHQACRCVNTVCMPTENTMHHVNHSTKLLRAIYHQTVAGDTRHLTITRRTSKQILASTQSQSIGPYAHPATLNHIVIR